ncbi:hypothetical protein Dred_1232 [Desulforamulus reducens MI-1]|uniref:Uncharacterized protein n=1 Tax=Desulforamulus reducens (strain ATCC BAA-1160 / DSM 100696 / MI-1) TaxID=349161 RepID=A4J3W3_DESRM|nr:hypothetical protein [Desulforamulus reducens]ABO49766.1 hypothetical protein Dred_1232 [Desulforamulus reducens MI-1]
MIEIEKRIYIDAYEDTRQNEEYINQVALIIKLGKEIMAMLGPDRKKIFLDYERQVGLSQRIYLNNVYRVGLKDGRNLACQALIEPNKMPNRKSVYL